MSSSSWSKKRSHGCWRKKCFGDTLQVNTWEVALSEKATWQLFSEGLLPFHISQDCFKGPSLLHDKCYVWHLPFRRLKARLCDISRNDSLLELGSFCKFLGAVISGCHIWCLQRTFLIIVPLYDLYPSLTFIVYFLTHSFRFCGVWYFKIPFILHLGFL